MKFYVAQRDCCLRGIIKCQCWEWSSTIEHCLRWNKLFSNDFKFWDFSIFVLRECHDKMSRWIKWVQGASLNVIFLLCQSPLMSHQGIKCLTTIFMCYHWVYSYWFQLLLWSRKLFIWIVNDNFLNAKVALSPWFLFTSMKQSWINKFFKCKYLTWYWLPWATIKTQLSHSSSQCDNCHWLYIVLQTVIHSYISIQSKKKSSTM